MLAFISCESLSVQQICSSLSHLLSRKVNSDSVTLSRWGIRCLGLGSDWTGGFIQLFQHVCSLTRFCKVRFAIRLIVAQYQRNEQNAQTKMENEKINSWSRKRDQRWELFLIIPAIFSPFSQSISLSHRICMKLDKYWM